MHSKANYIKCCLLIAFACVGLKGIAQRKIIDLILTDTAIHKELNYQGDTIRNFSMRPVTRFHDTVNFKSTRFLESAIFSGTIFLEYANFSNATFLNGFRSYNIHFSKNTNFLNAIFSDTADFDRAAFCQDVNFDNAKFLKNLNFRSAVFLKAGDFYNTTFSNTDFSYVTFSENMNFDDAKFLKEADFGSGKFLKDAIFFSTKFPKGVNFSYTVFSKNADFFDCKFKRYLDLSNIRTNDSTKFSFDEACLPDTLDFSENSKIDNEIDFTAANFADSSRYDYKADTIKPISIYLYKTDISKLHLDYLHFKLLLPDTSEEKFMLTEEIESMYEALLNNFKAHGQEESIKLCDIEYQTFKWKQNWWSRQFVWLPKWWWNWGYDKGLIFYRTLLFICIFTFITYFCIDYLNTKVYTVENIPPSFKNFGNRLWFSFIYTSSVFFRLTLKIENIKFERKLGTAYLILMYTIGLICLAYMANFVLQK